MDHRHHYAISVEWTGNRGEGTTGHRAYGREHVIRSAGKVHEIAGTADPAFFGDAERWNPEELLLTALSQCHMLSYLYVAARDGIRVVDYRDEATAVLTADARGGGAMTEATLRPVVTIAGGDPDAARAAHAQASRLCFIASSVAFPVHHEPTIRVAHDS